MSKDIHPTLARVYEISGFTKPSQLSNSLNIGASILRVSLSNINLISFHLTAFVGGFLLP